MDQVQVVDYHLVLINPYILNNGNFVNPLLPAFRSTPIFARLSVHVPVIISICGNLILTLATILA